jgi:hypothetical protein
MKRKKPLERPHAPLRCLQAHRSQEDQESISVGEVQLKRELLLSITENDLYSNIYSGFSNDYLYRIPQTITLEYTSRGSLSAHRNLQLH